MTPNQMPAKGSPLTTVTRHREVPCDVERSGGGRCCCETKRVKVPALKRGPRTIRSTAMADALRAKGLSA